MNPQNVGAVILGACRLPYLMRLHTFIDETVPSLMRLDRPGIGPSIGLGNTVANSQRARRANLSRMPATRHTLSSATHRCRHALCQLQTSQWATGSG